MARTALFLTHARGEMMRRVADMDWGRTPLGAMQEWPHALRMAIGICLPSRFPMCVFWGSEYIGIYNDAFISILGKRHPDALGKPVEQTWAEVWDLVRPQFEAVTQRGESTWNDRVSMVVERSGFPEEVYFTWSYSPIPDDEGAIGGLLCTVLEETGRVRTENALAETQRRLDSALIAGEVGTFEWDVLADRLWGDENFARLFNIELDATGAAPLASYLAAVHPDDRDLVTQRLQRTLETGCDYEAEYRIVLPEGIRWVVARGKVERDGDGRVVRFPGVVLDVTGRKVAEETLRASEARYRALIDSIDEGFSIIQMIFDGDDNPVDYVFLEGNPAWENHTGLRGVFGKRAREVLPDLEDHWFRIYGNVALTGEAIRFESGSEAMGRWFDVFAFRVDDPGERKVALLFKDITEQKRAGEERERLLRNAEAARADAEAANRAKADFLAAMSHDLRTPLNAIGGYVELLELGVRGPVTDAQRETLHRVSANQRHLLTLISDILQFAQVEAGRVEFDLEPLTARQLLLSIEPLVAPSAAARGIAYAAQDCEPELRLLGDEERVRQIVLNLVTNAIKFTPEGGSVLLSCEADAEWVYISVRDNGPGIPLEKQKSIFDPFVQSDRRLNRPREGVGLGLAISRDLAKAMGGELGVVSTPGEGSNFTLRMPRAEDG